MHINDLTIALYYYHHYNSDVDEPSLECSLFELSENRGVIHPDNISADGFFDAEGYIRFYCDRFKRFLTAGAAFELREYVYFLIESLIILTNRDLAQVFPETSAGTPFFEETEVIAALFQENQTRIVLHDAGADVAISYLDKEVKAPGYRLSPYFRDVTVNKTIWKRAAIEALDEYFSVAAERLQPQDKGELQNLVVRWRQHRAVFVGNR